MVVGFNWVAAADRQGAIQPPWDASGRASPVARAPPLVRGTQWQWHNPRPSRQRTATTLAAYPTHSRGPRHGPRRGGRAYAEPCGRVLGRLEAHRVRRARRRKRVVCHHHGVDAAAHLPEALRPRARQPARARVQRGRGAGRPVRAPARATPAPQTAHTPAPHSYLGLLYWLKASGRKAPAPARMFPVLIAANCAGIVLMCIAVPRSPFFSIWSLVLVNFIGGTVGYTQQVSSFALALALALSLSLSLVRLPRAALSFPRLPHPRAPSSSPFRT